MARVKRYSERMLTWVTDGTIGRIDAVRDATEDRADFVRAAIERELKRRERAAEPLAQHLAPPTARERAVRRQA